MGKLQISVLVDNTVNGQGLLAEHGLSFWIEHGSSRILFDTGQGNVIGNNIKRLGVQLDQADSIILSHGHYDHTGGLSLVLDATVNPRVYAHSQALTLKYSRSSEGVARYIGISQLNQAAIYSKANLILTEEPTEIDSGVWLTGPIPRTNAFENTGGSFFNDRECCEVDELVDDQALFLETESGTVVVLGCAHSGVINTLDYIRILTNNLPIHALIGGMHLGSASQDRIDATVNELRLLGIECIIPCHCTGLAASARLWNEFPSQCRICSVGTVIKLDA